VERGFKGIISKLDAGDADGGGKLDIMDDCNCLDYNNTTLR